ncbi:MULTISPECIES: zinc dependent phospholipase C family protein [unclassified Halanaerobium]|uniref:zinc dependent phospholipase C family protein n=1 Tax=unclassified Halanaerobium TaxID=2641197 RepID=UPI000DF41AB4|nr:MULTISPECIES: zinc dependent phospholipase C family protein [unclassified Halanaerobium]RCW49913.1 zinc dependent phospholipase C [Halanaerobium sp. MA284_MarDTE_T2]RCW88556.1 zinc dependent phospholipase C [Halanaerobium sp. DL-01]
MPDFWTHMISGQKVIKELENDNFRNILYSEMSWYNFGCQGPDFLFFNNFLPWEEESSGLKAAEVMHQQKTKVMLKKLIDYCKNIYNNEQIGEKTSKKLLAYTAGFLLHYSLDMKVHPFVYAHDGEGDRHKRIEMSLDIYLVKKEWDTGADFLKPTDYIDLGDRLPIQIEELYSYLLSTVFNYSDKIDFLQKSYLDFKKFHNIFYSPFKFKYIIFKLLNLFVKEDLSLYSYSEKSNNEILDEEDYRVFYQLFEAGIRQGTELLNLFYQYLNSGVEFEILQEKLPAINFLGRKI